MTEIHQQGIVLLRGLIRTAQRGREAVKPQPTNERDCKRFRMGQEGNNLVEFALVLPVLMMVVWGIASFGTAMMNWESLVHANAEGALYLVTNRTTITGGDPCNQVFGAISAAAPTLDPSKITLTVTIKGTAYGPWQGLAANTCKSALSDLAQGQTVTVASYYPCNISVYNVSVASSCNLPASIEEYEF